MKFDYTEKDTDGTFFDGEYGYLPGVEINIQNKKSQGLMAGFAFGFFSGEVDYDGAIQDVEPPIDANIDGLPFQTNTNETITTFTGHLSTGIDTISPDLSLYGKLSFKRWERDIQGRTISGIGNLGLPYQNLVIPDLAEVYEWWNLVIGLRYQFNINPGSNLEFNAGLLRTLDARMQLDLGPVAPTYNLQERWGYEAGVTWLTQISKTARLGFSGTYSYWEFGRSNVSFGFLEPDSESKMTAVKFIYQSDM